MTPAKDGLMLTEEVAEAFGVSGATVARWGQTGRLTSVQTPGGHRRYFAVEVSALIAGQGREAARKLAVAERERLAAGPG